MSIGLFLNGKSVSCSFAVRLRENFFDELPFVRVCMCLSLLHLLAYLKNSFKGIAMSTDVVSFMIHIRFALPTQL